jgi:hypothetical protein
MIFDAPFVPEEDPAAEPHSPMWWSRPLPWAGAAATVVLVTIGYFLLLSPEAKIPIGGSVEYVETDLPGASTVVYVDVESGWNIVWVVESVPDSDRHI